ncbi:MAG: pilin [Gammaproteobacteria bacterium]|nr:pilin [Gammaproteobacteria bacterium]MDH5736342.1 pilin [Gammaproteobacteria bacterium]
MLLFPVITSAIEKQYIREYTYDASEIESRVTARQNAIRILKAELLEEVSSYIVSENEFTRSQKNTRFDSEFKSKIKTISGGSVRSKVLDEKWDGKKLWLKAQLTVDPDQVKNDLDRLLAGDVSISNQSAVNTVPAVMPQVNTAMPVYNEYVQAAKLANIMAMITPVRMHVMQFYNMNGDWPANLGDVGLDTDTMTDGENIETVKLDKNGEIRVLLTKAYGNGKFISLKPRSIMGGTNIKWDCSTNLNKKSFSVPGSLSCKTI